MNSDCSLSKQPETKPVPALPASAVLNSRSVQSAVTDPKHETKQAAAPVLSQEAQEKLNKLRQIAGLWKYRDILPVPEQTPEKLGDTVRYKLYRADGGSVRGKKHIHGSTCCDDSFALRGELDGAILLTAVSDGAGSRKFSRIGARAACQAAVDSMGEGFRWLSEEQPECLKALRASRCGETEEKNLRAILNNAMRRAQETMYDVFEERIGKAGYEMMTDLRDLSATLLLTALIPSETGEHTIASCQVGDGAIALLDTQAPYETALTLLGTPDSGEYAGETEFLTSVSLSEDSMRRRTMVRHMRFDTVLVMTDGVADDYFPAKPELIRLYFDLCANGILPLRETDEPETGGSLPTPLPIPPVQAEEGVEDVPRASGSLPPQETDAPETGGSFPEPLRFPLIQAENAEEDPEGVPLNYTWLILDTLGLTLKDLWDNPAPLAEALRLIEPERDTQEQLLRWLEHYTETASFDDRTLVAVHIDKGGGEDVRREGQCIQNGTGKTKENV